MPSTAAIQYVHFMGATAGRDRDRGGPKLGAGLPVGPSAARKYEAARGLTPPAFGSYPRRVWLQLHFKAVYTILRLLTRLPAGGSF